MKLILSMVVGLGIGYTLDDLRDQALGDTHLLLEHITDAQAATSNQLFDMQEQLINQLFDMQEQLINRYSTYRNSSST